MAFTASTTGITTSASTIAKIYSTMPTGVNPNALARKGTSKTNVDFFGIQAFEVGMILSLFNWHGRQNR